MLEINGKLLSTQEIYDRLKVTQGLKTTEHNSTVQISNSIVFKQTDSYVQKVPMLDELGGVVFKNRYSRSFGLQITSSNFYLDEKGNIQSENVVLYTNKLVKDDTTTYLYNGLDRIQFKDGYLEVKAGEEDLLLFLRMHERNQTNHKWLQTDEDKEPKYKPYKNFLITEILPIKEAANEYDTVKKLTAVQVLCLDETRMPLELLIDMAASYGMGNVGKTEPKKIRVWLSQKATQNPDKFLKDYNSQSFKLSATMATAFDLGVITLNEGRRVKWGKETPYYNGGKEIILQLPAGTENKKHEVLASKLVERGDSETIDAIKKLIEAKKPKKENTENEDALFMAAEALGVTVQELLELKKSKEKKDDKK